MERSSSEYQDVISPRLGDADIEALSELGARRTLEDGEPLFQAGERRGGFFIILSGKVEIVDRSGDEPRVLAVHNPGEFTGDIDILSRRTPLVSAYARGKTEVMSVSSYDIRRIVSERPGLGDVILRAFIARRDMLLESGFRGVRVIGSERSQHAFTIRDFLARNQVPFTWIAADEGTGIEELLRGFGIEKGELPVVACGTEPLLRKPSLPELAEAIGIKRPLRRSTYDLVVVGAGPAGLAAAVYGASEGLSTLVLDRFAPGGQAGASTRIENYLGFPMGITGQELTGRATLQAQKFDVRFHVPERITGLNLDGALPTVECEGGERVAGRCVLIATGADYRKLDVPDLERFEGVGLYYSATPTEVSTCRGKEVVIVGGGNSAGQAAMFLSEHAERVLMLLRSGNLYKSMSSYLARRIEEAPSVDVLYQTEIRQMLGEECLEAIEVEHTPSAKRRQIVTPAVFAFIGAVPRTDWLPPGIQTDAKGFIRTGPAVQRTDEWSQDREPFLLETSAPGVFAAGDVRLNSIKRVASAVGEGAMVVKYAHEYLAEPGDVVEA